VLALHIAAFPERLPVEVISAIFAASSDTVRAAGGVVAGGHTIRSEEPIFGLAVQGLVHPDRVLTKGGALPGDVLVLSKPIGTGLVLAAGGADQQRAAVARMKVLNRAASEALVGLGAAVHAVTDVTGFGLAGHGWEMAERSGATLVIDVGRVPIYDGALAAAQSGVRTGGDARNREHLVGRVDSTVAVAFDVLAHDPQTSGGLLAAVEPGAAAELIGAGFVRIGEVASTGPGVVLR
jgi:selenide,water dikinase